jgi:nitrogen regulatory protein PII
MKIEAIFPSARLNNVFAALGKMDIGGLTYFESRGRGQLARPTLTFVRGPMLGEGTHIGR